MNGSLGGVISWINLSGADERSGIWTDSWNQTSNWPTSFRFTSKFSELDIGGLKTCNPFELFVKEIAWAFVNYLHVNLAQRNVPKFINKWIIKPQTIMQIKVEDLLFFEVLRTWFRCSDVPCQILLFDPVIIK